MIIAIILSGGNGIRMGSSIPKQYIKVNDKPIVRYAVEAFLDSNMIDVIIIALNEQWKEYVQNSLPNTEVPIYFSEPGETREHTIYNALKKSKEVGGEEDDIVIIHDSVRPLVSQRVIKDCIVGCEKYDAAIAAIDVKDTIYVSTEGECVNNVPNRSQLHAGQTPEAFKLGSYLRIHDESTYDEICNVTGGAQFAFQQGLRVFLSRGEEINFKITTPEDLERFKLVLEAKNS